jgi:hypothetical protein
MKIKYIHIDCPGYRGFYQIENTNGEGGCSVSLCPKDCPFIGDYIDCETRKAFGCKINMPIIKFANKDNTKDIQPKHIKIAVLCNDNDKYFEGIKLISEVKS